MICNLQIDCCGALVRYGTNATHQVVPSYLCLSR